MPIHFASHVRRFVPIAMIPLLCAATGLSTGACVHAQASDSATVSMPGSSDASSLAGPYLKWLDEDAQWIITPGERSAYVLLTSNDERMRFIQQFWERRNPEPGSSENKFKEEHYRRLAYANQHFASGGRDGSPIGATFTSCMVRPIPLTLIIPAPTGRRSHLRCGTTMRFAGKRRGT